MFISPMDCCPFYPQFPQEEFEPDFRGYAPMMIDPCAMRPQYGNAPSQQKQPISVGMPSQAPGGTTAAPPYPTPQALQGMEGAQFEMAPGSPVQQDVNYTQGYLRTQIGKKVLISFLIGTNTYQDRTGILESVGVSYVILREEGNTRLLCDIYSIKFVRIF